MKKFLSKTPVTQVLLILFCTLLLFILIARAVEFKGLENTESALSNTTQKSLQRQQIFTSMLNGSDDIRINTLNYLFYLNKNGKILAQEKINKTISSNEQLRLQYQQLIEDAEEQKLFDTVHLFETLQAQTLGQIFVQNKEGQRIEVKESKLFELYGSYQEANKKLITYVIQRDSIKTEQLRVKLAAIKRFKTGINGALLFLIIALGFIIVRTRKIMSVK